MEKPIEGKMETIIIDTKWKNIDQSQPSTHDLRQMYVYNEYWKSRRSLLLYPSSTDSLDDCKSFDSITEDPHHQCGLGKVSVLNMDGKLDEGFGIKILELFKYN